MQTKTYATPNEKLAQLTQKGRDLLNNPIRVTYTAQDVANAGRFSSCDDCLLFHALKRMGYDVQSVGPSGATIANKRWSFDPFSPNEPYHFWDLSKQKFLPTAIGKTLVLAKQ